MSRKYLCGDFPWKRDWFVKQNNKPPKYFCANCLNSFRTGKFSRFDNKIYDDVCPNCGAIGLTFEELIEEYKDIRKEMRNVKNKR